MKLINRENGEELVEVGSHKDYASKGVAGAGLGLGIAGTALWLLSGGKEIFFLVIKIIYLLILNLKFLFKRL